MVRMTANGDAGVVCPIEIGPRASAQKQAVFSIKYPSDQGQKHSAHLDRLEVPEKSGNH
jgi:hypothetical protein